MELTMVNGFNEMSLEEMREVDGGFAIIPAIKAVASAAKAVYSIPPVKKAVNEAVVGAGKFLLGYAAARVLDNILD